MYPGRTIASVVLLSRIACAQGEAPRPAAADHWGAIRSAITRTIEDAGDSDTSQRRVGTRQELRALYGTSGFVPLWVDSSGRPLAAARTLIGALLRIDDRGLDPADYEAASWDGIAHAIATAVRPDVVDAARLDVGLSTAFLAALSDLHAGRISPEQLGYHLRVEQRPPYDPIGAARSAMSANRIADAFAAAEPRFAQYHAIEAALARYRELDGDTTLEPIPAVRTPVDSGDAFSAAGVLRRWLTALGDLSRPASSSTDTAIYGDDLVDGVRSFQARHGMVPNGILDRATGAALREPLSHDVRRLELALERLRWIPDPDTGQLLVVNVPAFRLWVLDSARSNAPPTLAMNVIVGHALGRQTPVFDAWMRSIVFRPYWNVPRSIVRREIVPAVRRNPRYLADNDMELVSPAGPDMMPLPFINDTIDALWSGRVRLRQRPGPRNPLGLVKFMLSDDENIYLHGTPAAELFRAPRRDFSHGCIRVRDPVALALYVLRGKPDWTLDRIDSAMAGHSTLAVRLPHPVRVLVFYATAIVRPDGQVAFYPDVYGQDARLEGALRRGAPRAGDSR